MEQKKAVIIGGGYFGPEAARAKGAHLKRKPEGAGVTDQRVEGREDKDGSCAGTDTLTDGREIVADVVTPVIGSKSGEELASTWPGAFLSPSGGIRTARRLIKTMTRALRGAVIADQKPYSASSKPPIFPPLGPGIRNSRLFWIVGEWITRQVQGRGLVALRYRKALSH